MQQETALPAAPRALIWDAPTRVGHWLLVASLLGCWLTAGEENAGAHVAFEAVASLLAAFQLTWSFSAPGYAGWRWLLHRPAAIWQALCVLAGRRGELVPVDPLRGTLHLVLLVGIPVMGLTGLAVDALPGGHLVGRLHEAAYVAVGLMVAAHVALVLYAGWLYRENLPACMVTGTYQAPAHEAIADAKWPVAIMLAFTAGAVWAWFAFGWGGA